jgi:hypothetical protein
MALPSLGHLLSHTLLWSTLTAHPHYTFELPNGNNVFHNDQFIAAIGHVRPNGHGPLNAFGVDFMREGHTWTEKLCRTDSDHDGRSNGVELGDANCTWKRPPNIGEDAAPPPLRGDGVITHPGISNENSWPALAEEVEVHAQLTTEEEGLAEDDDDESDDCDGESFDDE